MFRECMTIGNIIGYRMSCLLGCRCGSCSGTYAESAYDGDARVGEVGPASAHADRLQPLRGKGIVTASAFAGPELAEARDGHVRAVDGDGESADNTDAGLGGAEREHTAGDGLADAAGHLERATNAGQEVEPERIEAVDRVISAEGVEVEAAGDTNGIP